MSRSSAEAEYSSMVPIITFRLMCPHLDLVPLYCYSKEAHHIVNDPGSHQRTNNIEVDYHFVRDCIQRGLLVCHHISTQH